MAKLKGKLEVIGGKSEAEWQAEDDARTLKRAEEIKADPKRLKAAKAMATRKAKEEADDAAMYAKIGK